METWQKGEIAVCEVTKRAIEMGWTVLKPTVEGTRYDLVFDACGEFIKVQVKYVTSKFGAATVPLTKVTKNTKTPRLYKDYEIDAVIVFIPDTEKLYWIPFNMVNGKKTIRIRHEPTKNNQIQNVIDASNLEW